MATKFAPTSPHALVPAVEAKNWFARPTGLARGAVDRALSHLAVDKRSDQSEDVWSRAVADLAAIKGQLAAEGLSSDTIDALTDKESAAGEMILTLPVETLEQATVKLRTIVDLYGHEHDPKLVGLIADLERLQVAA